MSTKNAIGANDGTTGNMGGDVYSQAAGFSNAFQDAAALNANPTLADGGDQEASQTQTADVDQTDNNNVSMNIVF